MRNNLGKPLKVVESKHTERFIPRLIYITWAVYLVAMIYGIIWNEKIVIIATLISSILLLIPLWLHMLGRFQTSNFVFVILLLISTTLLATVGQGIHDVAIMAYPVIIIFGSLGMNRFGFRIIVLLALASMGWLVFGEAGGLFVSKTYETPQLFDFITVAALLLAAAFTVNLLSATMRRNLTQARSEIVLRKQAEVALTYERDKAKKYLEIANVMILSIDKDGIVTLINNKGCEILDCEQADIIGKNWFDSFIPSSIADEVKNVFKSIIAKKIQGLENYENAIVTAKGEERILSWHNSFIRDEDGNINGILSSAIDITEIKRLEEEKKVTDAHLNQQQRLESIGTLAGGVAHEINNPINGIMNYGQLLLDSSSANSENAEYAKEIIFETKRVAIIVENLLRFSRDEKQEHSYAIIKDVIEQTLSLIKTVIKHDQIDLQIDIPDDLPKLKCRSQQIQQVIMNLLTNARDTLNEKHEGYHKDKIIKLLCKQFNKDNRSWLRITVEDHGNGIPESMQENIFEPFFTSKSRDKGTGLGLSISYGIVKEHLGELTFKTKEGSYTKFYLDLPVENGWEQERN
jgi:PAS domain S-box-containing protein